jgi:hypothetical protein
VFLGLHSLLFPTKVKAATANTSYNFALFASDSLRSPTGSAGGAAQQHSTFIIHFTISRVKLTKALKTLVLSFFFDALPLKCRYGKN